MGSNGAILASFFKLSRWNKNSFGKNERLLRRNENSFVKNEKLSGWNENFAMVSSNGNLTKFIAFNIVLEK